MRFDRNRIRACVIALACVMLCIAPSLAHGAEKAGGGASEVIFIVQLVLLLLVGRVLGELMQRIDQPAIIGQLLAGILLGASVFGMLWPEAHHMMFPDSAQQKGMIRAVGDLGVLMILMLTGMEIDLGLVKRIGRAAVVVSVAGVALPFACGFALGQALPDSLLADAGQRLVASLFLGTALSISSVKIVALVVRDMNFLRRDIGQIIVASAIIEDTIGWIIIAIIFGIASRASFDFAALGESVVGTVLFLAASLTIGRRLMFLLIRWSNDLLVSEYAVITTILVVTGGMALITHALGVHTVLGAFVAGILIGESPILVRYIDQQLRGMITALFMPVFFGLAGLEADLTVLRDPHLLLLTAGLVLIASVGKFSGAFVGGKLGGLSAKEALALGCAMNARGSTEVIVATIGLTMGILSQQLFTMILAMAVITTTAMPPMLRWALLRLPMRRTERERLRREEMDKRGFITGIERLLLAVDDGANGKFASRLAGAVAGFRGMPATVLQTKPNGRPGRSDGKDPAEDGPSDAPREMLADEAKKSRARATADKHEPDPKAVDLTVREHDARPADALRDEAHKGYDLLWVGIEKVVASATGFSRDVSEMAEQFPGALAIVLTRGEHARDPTGAMRSILVPADGAQSSRNAAELALLLARANDAKVTVLYVTRGRRQNGRQGRERAIMRDLEQLAERYGVTIKTTVRSGADAGRAILRELDDGDFDLVLLGASRRSGNPLFLGDTAAAVLENAQQSIVFLADRTASGPGAKESQRADRSGG